LTNLYDHVPVAPFTKRPHLSAVSLLKSVLAGCLFRRKIPPKNGKNLLRRNRSSEEAEL
jgi:hypothetical protein